MDIGLEFGFGCIVWIGFGCIVWMHYTYWDNIVSALGLKHLSNLYLIIGWIYYIYWDNIVSVLGLDLLSMILNTPKNIFANIIWLNRFDYLWDIG